MIKIYENALCALMPLFRLKSISNLELLIINHWQASLASSVNPVLCRIGHELMQETFDTAWALACQYRNKHFNNEKFRLCYYTIAYIAGELNDKNEARQEILNWPKGLMPNRNVILLDVITNIIKSES